MRAFVVQSHTQEPVFLDMPETAVAAGQVAMDIASCALNFADLLLIRGTYQEMPPLPFSPGLEFCGRVTALGEGVTHLSIGDRVATFAGSGGLATKGNFPANRCVKLPDTLDDVQAAAILVAYGTSHLALTDRAQLKSGETLLVTGAAGGVGLTAVELGASMGARVVAIARGADKLTATAEAGASITIDSDDPDLMSKLKELGGVDVVYDTVGGDLFKPCLRACAPEARYLAIGFASGTVPKIPANILLVKNITVQGFYWGGVMAYAPQKVLGSLAAVFDMVARGEITPKVRHVFAFEDTMDALALLKDRKSTGKVVVKMP